MHPVVKKYKSYIIPVMILVIGAAYVWLTSLVEYRGDDLAYANGLHNYVSTTGHSAWRYPLSHLKVVNGRFGDTFNFILLDFLPRPLLNMMCGIAVALFYWLILRLGIKGKSGITGKIAVIALITFTFQWWDLFLMLVVQINYIWGAVLNLSCIYIMKNVKPSRYRTLLLIPLFFISPAMHEACGLPIIVATLFYILIRRRGFNENMASGKKPLFIAYGIGALMPLASPAFYGRVFSSISSATPDDSPFMVFLKSDYFVVIAVMLVGILLMTRKKRLHDFLLSDSSFWFVAALVSSTISAVSGVVGRSGWFAQTFALIAILQLLSERKLKIQPLLGGFVSVVFSVLILIHFYGLVRWQTIFHRLTHDILTQYRTKPGEIIYSDYIYFSDAPWWLLGKHLGMFDASDQYALETEQWVHHLPADTPMIILPKALKFAELSNIKLPYPSYNSLLIPNTGALSNTTTIRSKENQYMLYPFHLDGRDFILIRKRDTRPGDR